MGTAPLPPVAKNDLRAIGRTNDCILYGGRRATRSAPATRSWRSWPQQVPASASRDYGTPFYEIFQRYEGDFYKIDPLLFSPAEVWLTSTESGRTFHAGQLNPDVLRSVAATLRLRSPHPTRIEHGVVRRSCILAAACSMGGDKAADKPQPTRRPRPQRRRARRRS